MRRSLQIVFGTTNVSLHTFHKTPCNIVVFCVDNDGHLSLLKVRDLDHPMVKPTWKYPWEVACMFVRQGPFVLDAKTAILDPRSSIVLHQPLWTPFGLLFLVWSTTAHNNQPLNNQSCHWCHWCCMPARACGAAHGKCIVQILYFRIRTTLQRRNPSQPRCQTNSRTSLQLATMISEPISWHVLIVFRLQIQRIGLISTHFTVSSKSWEFISVDCISQDYSAQWKRTSFNATKPPKKHITAFYQREIPLQKMAT